MTTTGDLNRRVSYSGRTLEAYRQTYAGFQWAADNHLDVLKATRPHIELFRAWMEDRQLAASTIDPHRTDVQRARSQGEACGPRRARSEHVARRWSRTGQSRPRSHPGDRGDRLRRRRGTEDGGGGRGCLTMLLLSLAVSVVLTVVVNVLLRLAA